MDTRFRRDLYTKTFYAGLDDPDNTYDPTKPFIRSNWEPPDQFLPPELKLIMSYFQQAPTILHNQPHPCTTTSPDQTESIYDPYYISSR